MAGETVRGPSEDHDRAGSRPTEDDRLAEEATAWFVRLASDRVGADDRRTFDAWLQRDPAHGRAYREVEALWGELGNLPDPRPDPRPDPQPHPRPDPRPARKTPVERPAGRWRWAGALAASVLVAAALTLWGEVAYDRWRADHATVIGETRSVTLSDGSRVELNTDTAFAVHVTEDRRRIDLFRGEAFFTVAPDPARPFQVVAGGATATALGTAFAVRLFADGVAIGVSEGRVALAAEPGPALPADAVTVTAGVEGRLHANGAIETRTVDIAARTAWRRGRLIFADRPLRAVVAELDRYRPGAILLVDTSVAEARFTGALGLADTDQALAAIESALPVAVHRLTPWLTILTQEG